MIGSSPTLDKDRIQRNKKSREIQIQRWQYFDNEYEKQKDRRLNNNLPKGNLIHFTNEIILLDAVARNDLKEVKELLERGVNPNASTVDGLSGLHQCCIEEYFDMAELLLKHNADVNIADTELWTPLHAAATCGNTQMVKLLSKYDANFLAINADGDMPYDICEGDQTLSVVEQEMSRKHITQDDIDNARLETEQIMLNDIKERIRNKKDIDSYDAQGATLLHIACSMGCIEAVRSLLEACANVNRPDKDTWLPIHIAACWGHTEIVELLVAFGANIESKTSSGETVFDICEPELKDKLLYIKENAENIRKNFKPPNQPQNKSFRKNRGSSIRRTSIRQKNMMSRKEAKEEFITINQSLTQNEEISEKIVNENPVESVVKLKMNKGNHDKVNSGGCDEEGSSDIDDCEGVEFSLSAGKTKKNEPSKMNFQNQEKHVRLATQAAESVEKSNNTTSRLPNVSRIEANRPVETKSEVQTSIPNNHNSKSVSISFTNGQKDCEKKTDATLVSPVLVDALDRPKYIFASTTESWDADRKESRKRGCCALL